MHDGSQHAPTYGHTRNASETSSDHRSFPRQPPCGFISAETPPEYTSSIAEHSNLAKALLLHHHSYYCMYRVDTQSFFIKPPSSNSSADNALRHQNSKAAVFQATMVFTSHEHNEAI